MSTNNATPVQPTDPVNLGIWIRQQLVAAEAVTTIVGNKIFPFTTADPQNLPWLVWDNLQVSFEDTKDGTKTTGASFSIFCAGATPESSATLATAVKNALNGNTGCRISQWSQGFTEDTQFSNDLQFIIEF
uniref:Uncharacterized protein n=1 Tax=uncultured bacterium fosmid pJB83B9 TaxID=1478070 RepID=A0A0H3U7W0_9BACT|nr:hypothetical protein [uncultured bacterium fosmid pJB83B9]